MPNTLTRVATLAAVVAVLAVGVPGAGASTDTPSHAENETIGIDINCSEGWAQFTADENTSYTASLTVIDMSPTSVSSERRTQTVTGNATFSTNMDGDVFGAFATYGTLGDNDTVSEIEVCDDYYHATDENDTDDGC